MKLLSKTSISKWKFICSRFQLTHWLRAPLLDVGNFTGSLYSTLCVKERSHMWLQVVYSYCSMFVYFNKTCIPTNHDARWAIIGTPHIWISTTRQQCTTVSHVHCVQVYGPCTLMHMALRSRWARCICVCIYEYTSLWHRLDVWCVSIYTQLPLA